MNLLASVAVFFALLQVPPPSIPATFSGIYRGIESGHVVIEVEGGQDMRMFVTGSTKFIRDGRPSKASQFHDGDAVSVDAKRDLRMNLVALRVEAVKPAPAKPDGATEKPH
jgi:hypothetical protein